MAAIAEELAGTNDPPADAGPMIEISSGTMGRETLAAIAAELLPSAGSQSPPARPRTTTLGYEEGAFGSERMPPRPAGRHPSLESLENRLAAWAQGGESAEPNPAQPTSEAPSEIYEMVTFVVRGDLARLSSTRARREFVAERLLRRLPVGSMAEVDRVDVTPWTVHGTVIVRVWCRVP